MRYCGYIRRECSRLVYSAGVTFTAPNLIVDLPAGSYGDRERYCVVITSAIPAETTIDAPVFFTIGGGTELYPFTDCTGAQLTARNLAPRTRYSVRVSTTPTGGAFNLLGRACVMAAADNNLTAIDGTAPTEGGAAG